MNHALIIKATNRVAFFATVALIFWVIVFLTITVFDLKIFRDRMTETFYLSILGIFAILGGALILNVMSNLSRISEAVATREAVVIQPTSTSRWKLITALLSVPIIVGLMFGADALSAQKRKEVLVSAAKAMVSENQKELTTLAAYDFSNDYIAKAAKILSVMEKIDKNFPDVAVILPDTIDGKSVFLAFRKYDDNISNKSAEKQKYIYSSTKEDRAYLVSVFSGGKADLRFLAKGGNYELFQPVNVGGKIIVLYFSDFQRYGKIGS